jgi:hypothetical protein
MSQFAGIIILINTAPASHLERKFVTLVDGSNLCRGERLWGMQV